MVIPARDIRSFSSKMAFTEPYLRTDRLFTLHPPIFTDGLSNCEFPIKLWVALRPSLILFPVILDCPYICDWCPFLNCELRWLASFSKWNYWVKNTKVRGKALIKMRLWVILNSHILWVGLNSTLNSEFLSGLLYSRFAKKCMRGPICMSGS